MALLYAIGKFLNAGYSSVFSSLLLLLALLGNTGDSYGQTSLTGTVSDTEGLPVKGANLLVRADKAGQILAFALTAEDGSYQINLPAAPDSLWLTLSHLAYASQDKLITNRPERLDWELVLQAYTLPEMEVRQNAVERHGDTLVFDVNQLREVQDENIEQILSRIPGIRVESRGRIFYQELPISKFYIEGLDLLEGRYALATRNLNIGAIRDIEILERHQSIRALDSIVKPPNAAINLRLKSSITFTGELEAGGGVAPALYQAQATVFGFQKQQQFSLLGAANNTGRSQSGNFRDLYAGPTFEIPLVRPTVIFAPALATEANTSINREATGGFNLLRKFGEYSQLKTQVYHATDRLRYRGQRQLTLVDEDTAVTFEEQLDAEEKPSRLNGRLTYELNRPRFYTKALLEAEHGSSLTRVDNVINGLISEEEFNRDDLVLRGRLNTLFSKDKKAYQLWSNVKYTDKSYELGLYPLDLIVPDFPYRRLDSARQLARERLLTSDTYTNYIWGNNKLTAQARGGITTEWQHITSDLLARSPSDSATTLGLPFQNDSERLALIPYLDQELIWKREHSEWELNLPLAWHRVSLRDGLSEDQPTRGLLVTEPKINYTYELPTKQIFNAELSFRRDYDRDQLFFNRYLLRANRQFDRQAFTFNQRNRYQFGLRFRGQDLNLGVYYNSHLTLSATTADLLTTTVFDSRGQASILTESRNVRHRLSWNNQLEFSPWPGVQAKMSGNYSLSGLPQRLNGTRLNVNTHYVTAEPYLAYSLGSSVFSAKYRVNYYDNNLSAQPTWHTQWRAVYFQELPRKQGKLNLSFEYYRTRSGPRLVANHLLNFWYKRHLSAWKTDVSLHLNNLTNTGDFISFTQGSYYQELEMFRLRPRQLLFVLERKF